MEISLAIDDTKLRQAIRRFPHVLYSKEMRALKDALPRFLLAMKQARMSGRPGITGGRIAKSLKGKVSGRDLGSLTASASFSSPLAKYQEAPPEYSDIRPIHSRYLKIPLKRGQKDEPGIFCYRSKKGNLLLAKKTASGLKNLFVLKKHVRVKRRLGFKEFFKKYESRFVATIDGILTRVCKEF